MAATKTTTVLFSSATDTTVGQGVVFSALVNAAGPGALAPTGTVSFTFDGNASTVVTVPVRSSVTPGQAFAQFFTRDLPVGNPTVIATCSGDSANSTSASPTLVQAVIPRTTPAPTTTIDLASFDPDGFSPDVIITAVVAAPDENVGEPTGTLTYVIDGVAMPPVRLLTSSVYAGLGAVLHLDAPAGTAHR